MALRYLTGKLWVPAGAALRRIRGSRGVAHRSSQEVPSVREVEDLKRLLVEHAALIRQMQNYDAQLALYLCGGTILGVFIGSLMLRYEHRSGGKIGKFMRGISSD